MQRTPPELTTAARRLRRDATPAERKLWIHLRGHRPRFTRQLVVDHYILDFACRSVKLGIELDGGQHAWREAEDAARTAWLERQGWRVMRFWNAEVVEAVDDVLRRILAEVARASTHPRPLPCREGRVAVASGVLESIMHEALSDIEICGLLFGASDRIETARACANVHPAPARAFELDPAALLAAHRAQRAGGPAIVGHYHSHPSGRAVPSATDLAAAAPGQLWLIAAAGAVRAWRARDGGFDELALVPG